jgi:tetratricopeptide (TPR) repeat protein
VIVSPQAPSQVSDTARLREKLRANDGLYLRDPDIARIKAIHLHREAKETGDKSLIAACLMELGKCQRQCSDLAASRAAFREALNIFTSLGDRQNIPKALQALGTIHSAMGKLEDALRCYSGALPLAQANKDWFAVQRILNSWGIVAIRLGDYPGALRCFTECLELLHEMPDPYLESSVLANSGAIFERSEAYEKAIEHFERSLKIARELNDSRQIGNTLIFLANSSAQLGKMTEAQDYAEESLAIGRKHHYTDIASQALVSLADMAIKEHLPHAAIPRLMEAKTLLEGTPNTIHFQKVMHTLGSAYLELDNIDDAKQALQLALDIAKSIGSPQLLYFTYQELANLASRSHDYKVANEYLMQALKQHELLNSERNQSAINMLELSMAMDAYRRNRIEQNRMSD